MPRSTICSMMAVSVAAVSLRDRPAEDRRLHVLPLAVPNQRAHDARLNQLAAVGHRADRRHHLQRRHADLIAHRHRRERAAVELAADPRRCRLSRRENPARARGRIRSGARTVPAAPRPSLKPDLDGADVARLHDHIGERQRRRSRACRRMTRAPNRICPPDDVDRCRRRR